MSPTYTLYSIVKNIINVTINNYRPANLLKFSLYFGIKLMKVGQAGEDKRKWCSTSLLWTLSCLYLSTEQSGVLPWTWNLSKVIRGTVYSSTNLETDARRPLGPGFDQLTLTGLHNTKFFNTGSLWENTSIRASRCTARLICNLYYTIKRLRLQ